MSEVGAHIDESPRPSRCQVEQAIFSVSVGSVPSSRYA
jgi:hypothetical protein